MICQINKFHLVRALRPLLIEILEDETFGKVTIDKQGSPLWLLILSVKHFRVLVREFYEHHGAGEVPALVFGTSCCLSYSSIHNATGITLLALLI